MPEQGSTYATFIEAALKAERDRRIGVETRALSVITSSGAFVTVIVAVGAWVLGKDYTYISRAKYLVFVALALFIASGFAALMAGQLRKYDLPSPETLTLFLSGRWSDTETTARNNCSWLNLDTLISHRIGNSLKTWWLDWALRLQVLAVVSLSIGLAWEIF